MEMMFHSSPTQSHYINPQGTIITYDPTKSSSRRDELSYVNTEDLLPFQALEECYVVNAQWLDNWYNYVNAAEENKSLHPGTINNEILIDGKTGKLKNTASLKTSFRPVKKSVWEYLFSIYGSRAIIYFQVPELFDEKMYKKGTWAKNINFNKIGVHVIYSSHESPKPFVDATRTSFDLSAKHARMSSDMTLREVPLTTRTNYDTVIVGHELKKNLGNKPGYYIVYIIHVIPPDHLSERIKPWSVLRRYDDFSELDRLLQKICRKPTFNTLKVPKLPGKRYFRSSTSLSFIEKRQVLLETYLKQFGSQPLAWNCDEFQRFLNKDIESFVEDVKRSESIAKSQANERKTQATPLLEKEESSLFCCFRKKASKSATPATPPRTSPAPAIVTPPSVVASDSASESSDRYSETLHTSKGSVERKDGSGGGESNDGRSVDGMSDIDSKTSSHSFQPKIRSHHRHSTTTGSGTGLGTGSGLLGSSASSVSSDHGSSSNSERHTPSRRATATSSSRHF